MTLIHPNSAFPKSPSVVLVKQNAAVHAVCPTKPHLNRTRKLRKVNGFFWYRGGIYMTSPVLFDEHPGFKAAWGKHLHFELQSDEDDDQTSIKNTFILSCSQMKTTTKQASRIPSF
ncbi:hypothetical protein AVEN_186373-1 [Araneus ventricosus]|uniref:Uncharacterized protein n=1 Tax=Araneus ventricosus TaxID=182803 RepID=A0A4Y2T5Z1_ARAVE|nr:hypothetical protein AVEN_186373-1 [Araneus ventricosus]